MSLSSWRIAVESDWRVLEAAPKELRSEREAERGWMGIGGFPFFWGAPSRFKSKSWSVLIWMMDNLGCCIVGNLELNYFSCCVSVVGNIAPENLKTLVFEVSGI